MNARNLTLRPASIDDLELLNHWDEQPHVIESDPNDDWGWEDQLGHEVPWREQLMAELDGRPIGFIEIIDPAEEEEHYWGEVKPNLRAIDIWIGEADALNQGHGTRMMTLAIERCFSAPEVTAIIIDPLLSNVRAQRFYERLGFRAVEDRQFGLDLCLVMRLERGDWERRR
jgi:aminoglycoside 6'-N-acetyltransferase